MRRPFRSGQPPTHSYGDYTMVKALEGRVAVVGTTARNLGKLLRNPRFASAESAGPGWEVTMSDQRSTSVAEVVALETRGPDAVDVGLSVNGMRRVVSIEPRVSLLDALREHLDLTGTKKGCDQGTCGACTVWLDGRRILACLTLAIACEGHDLTTIEGLAAGEELHPMQRAFVAHDAFQCGYCTPGQIMSAVALLAEGHAATDAEIREWMSGNICRCAAYPNIRAAIREVRDAAGGHHHAAP
jgi:xanthine dehydrogenase YagT iron-sulfur-binding subunit